MKTEGAPSLSTRVSVHEQRQFLIYQSKDGATRIEGNREVTREVEHYNLDMVLALGFRVRSPVGVRFRRWANDKLKEYLVKGFVLDDARLKNPGKGTDYFDELTRRLQDIRTSERRFYQKITDIYATSVDYDGSHELTQTFFATVQNKVHYAVHGQTAAELIAARADSSQPNMGLGTWQGGRIRKADVSVAKNYLSEDELRVLNNLAEQYLIFAEGQAMRRIAMSMRDWIRPHAQATAHQTKGVGSMMDLPLSQAAS